MKIYIAHLILLYTFLHAVHGITVYDARLINGYHGTVEVLTHQGWLPICHTSSSYWSTSESSVLCRQLGYDVTSNPSTGSTSSQSSTLRFDFSCSGNELQISECSYTLVNSYPSSSCSPVIIVTCSPCTEGSVQLRGGVAPEAGTVEYCTSGIWKAVCGTNWDYKDAFVVCRELGLPATDVIPYSNSYFGDHPTPSGLYFNCFGNETSLTNCQSSTTTCDFANVAGIYCRGDVITALCTEGLLRLVDGCDEDEGRIEICSNGVWGTIYAGSGNWDVNDASVVCRQLGYQRYSRVEALRVSNGYFEGGTGPILFGNLYCNGMESRLTHCSSSYNYAATHSDDAGVRCLRTAATTQTCTNGEARLMNGSTVSEGRVEICYDGIWGSVCDSSWDNWDAAIVCMQLGFQGANATAIRGSYFGDGDGPYHLSGIGCSGEEKTLLQCSHNTIGYHTCTPGHDAGVRCDASVCAHHELRLFRDDSLYQYGIAEICINGFWADICYSYTSIASKFCKEYLGLQSLSFGQPCCSGISSRNTGNLTLYGISCNGLSDLFTQDCFYSIVSGYSSGGCNLRNELIVGCYLQSNCTPYDIRLVGGNSSMEGRVETCYENLWGTIADQSYSWNANNAMVVCRQLGLPWEWALAVNQNDLFGRGNGRIVARSFRCTGSEEQLINCYSYNYVPLSSGTSYQFYRTVGVICQGDSSKPSECEHGDVHLIGGSTKTEGRVEFCAYGYWAIACATFWNSDETDTVCKQLGFPTDASEYVLGSVFGSDYRRPLIGLSCGQGASHISECQFYNQTNNCNHKRTVGIICKERNQYYQINIYTTPEQESYNIGSQVTLNCTATPAPQKYGDDTFPLRYYVWYQDGTSRFTSSSQLTLTVPLNLRKSSMDHYCLIYRNGLLLGTGQTTLHIKSVLRINSTMSSLAKVRVTQGQNLTLQVEMLDHDMVKSLLELTWYHNNTLVLPGHNTGFSLSSNNKTLNITNFTSTYGGVYKAQFNQLFVHPYNEDCKNDFLSLMKNHPILKPAVFCVNVKENDCFDSEIVQNQATISVQNLDSNILGTFPQNLSLKAIGVVSSSKQLKHSNFHWYRSGSQIWTLPIQKHYGNLSLTQELRLFNTSYEHAGKYEVLLVIDLFTYLRDSGCESYYSRFVTPYLNHRTLALAQGHVDLYYYDGLTFNFDADSKAATRDQGATLTCRASIQFPPFSMLSLIKNGQTVATSSNGLLQINTKGVNANPFGLYICQLKASGAIFQKSYFLEDQAWLRMTINTGSSSICVESFIKEALLLKIMSECHCTFDQSFIHESNLNCKNGELDYSATIQYSNENGSETASVIAERIVGQVPFSLTVNGVLVTVTSACTDCRALMLTSAVGGGLFVGGFVAATLTMGIVIVIIVLVMRKRRLNATDVSHGEIIQETEVATTRYAMPNVQNVPTRTTEVKKLNVQQTPREAKKLNVQQRPREAKKLNVQQRPREAKKLNVQQRPRGNQLKAKVDPRAHYDTPRAQGQAATASQGKEISQEKDVYEAMDPEIYEETF